MRFDWYQATVPEHPIRLVEVLGESLGVDSVEPGKGRHNYLQSFRLLDSEGHRVAEVLAGGSNGHPNVTSSGEGTQRFVDALRLNWPEHNVTRVDSAEDFTGAEVFTQLETACRSVASACRVKGRSIVPDDLSDGRTYYLGAPSSDVRVRLYDKAAELRRKLPPDAHSKIPEHLIRLEAQVRPRKEYKSVACRLAPEQVWACAGWTAQLYQDVFHLPLERIAMQAGRETDHARAYRFMLQQYAKVLRTQCLDLGSWSAVGLQIGEDLAKIARAK